MATIKCNHCGQDVDAQAKFCPKCGNTLANANSQQGNQWQNPNNGNQWQNPNNSNQWQNPNNSGQWQNPNPGFQTMPNGDCVRTIDPIQSIKLYFQNYVNFEGRARRAEYWWPCLLSFILSFIPYINIIAGLGMIIPSIAVGVRRLHDTNRSGWFLLLGLIPIVGTIILIIWFCQEGNRGSNQYGPDPKYLN